MVTLPSIDDYSHYPSPPPSSCSITMRVQKWKNAKVPSNNRPIREMLLRDSADPELITELLIQSYF